MNASVLFGVLIVLSQLCGLLISKECTNVFPLPSHTLRYSLLSSNNETWKREMFSRYNLDPSDGSAFTQLFRSLPRKKLREKDQHEWGMMYGKINGSDGYEGVPGLLNEISLHDVRLDPNSMHGKAQQTNLEYLLMLDVDRLLWSFRGTAGLPTPGQPYGGWEAPDSELRGHFVGHYLSATAKMWASTHNDTVKQKMNALVSALSECQKKIGTGYLSAFPTEFFDRLEALIPVWAPYYTMHKILAGLLDQYTLAGNEETLKMATWMVDYFDTRVQNVIKNYTIERHYASLNEESGGMNDVLYRLYTITGDQKHLILAHLFDKPCFLGLLAVQADSISNFHTNTHVAVVVGAQLRYEVTGDPLYKEIGAFFMNIVNSSHAYATGGTSVGEFWSDPKRLADTLQAENEESCTTYNMLKVSRHLFRWTKEIAYADYYERALTNGVLSIQRGREPGVMIYMLPMGRGVSKALSYHGWGTPNDSFWCCYGTASESFSKLGDSIYFEEQGKVPTLYVIQYISSSFNWKCGEISVSQKVEPVVSWDPRIQVTFNFTSAKRSGVSSTLNFRIPLWARSDGAKALLNGRDLKLAAPGNFLSVSRQWSTGDQFTFQLPISLRTEAIKDDRPQFASLQAILYGPYLLAGLSLGDWDINAKPDAPFSQWITPVSADCNSHLISLSQESGQATFSIMNSNYSLIMGSFPQPGTDSAVNSTFRLILNETTRGHYSRPADAIGKLVMLEPFNLPGMVIVHNGEGQNLGVSSGSPAPVGSVFRMVAGLDGKNTTVSFESEDKKGCFIYSGVNYQNGTSIKLGRSSGSPDAGFKQASSFTLCKGVSEYHPISFVAKGLRRQFLLTPLLSLRDESYTVYFNFAS